PAAALPTTASVPGRSAACTAKPSIAELGNGGRSTTATASAAVTRPAAAQTETVSEGRACDAARTSCCASATQRSAGPSTPYRPARPDTVIGGRYRLTALLGRGGMSEVWSAEDVELGRRVAIKLLGADADSTRFEREARAVASLSHPNVMQVFDYGED